MQSRQSLTNPDILRISLRQLSLIVYENKDKDKQFPLKPSQILDQLAETEKDALIVIVPTSLQLPF
jgi:hypothetical protein